MSTSCIVVAGAPDSLDGLEPALRALGLGATVERAALLAFAQPDDWEPLDQALDRLADYSAVAFTSPRAVAAVESRVESRESRTGRESRVEGRGSKLENPTFWAVGPATAKAMRASGWGGAVRVSTGSGGADLAGEMLAAGVRGRALHPTGDPHRPDLADALRAGGVSVDEPICYRSVLARVEEAEGAMARADLVVVTSPRVARLLAGAKRDARPPLVAIGPATGGAASEAGWSPDAVAEAPTPEAVAHAMVHLLRVRTGEHGR